MITLTAKQNEAWWCVLENPLYRRVLFDGGARSTKTTLICLWLLKEAGSYPGAAILVARKNRNAAEKSVWQQTFRKLLQGRNDFRLMDSDMEIHHVNGSMIRVDGLDDQDRVMKILGTEYCHIFFNEAVQLSWRTVNLVLSRLAQPVEGVQVRKAIFDCNPVTQRHWLYKVGVQRLDPDSNEPLRDADAWARRQFYPRDNPVLPADAMKTLEALSGVQRRRLLEGEWCENEGAVYDEFDEDVHVFRGAMPAGFASWSKVRGVDFGYVNPFVRLCAAIDPDGGIWIYRERYVRQQTVDEHARAIKAADHEVYEWTVADHDAEDRATLHKAGIPTVAAIKDVEVGVKAVKQRLKDRRLHVHESCTETIGEWLDYAWAQAVEGRNAKEVPVKDRDHAMDTVRYIVMAVDRRGVRVQAKAITREDTAGMF